MKTLTPFKTLITAAGLLLSSSSVAGVNVEVDNNSVISTNHDAVAYFTEHDAVAYFTEYAAAKGYAGTSTLHNKEAFALMALLWGKSSRSMAKPLK